MNVQRLAFTVHRWFSYLVFAQVLAWILGGCVFALLPHESVVKGGAYVRRPTTALPADWPRALAAASIGTGEVKQVASFVCPHGAAFRLRGAEGATCVMADGTAMPAPDSASVAAFAKSIYTGPGQLTDVRRVERADRKLGIVRETGDRHDLWRAQFADRLHSRLWFEGETGEYLTIRNDAWVVYDFFWRLHVFQWAADEDDLNNPLLRFFAFSALPFAISGVVLTWLAARRALKSRRVATLRTAPSEKS